MEITRESGSIQEAAAARQVVISVEFVAYLLLALLALALRFAELDIVPMTDAESREALAAWRALYPEAAGGVIVPQSPLLFFLHSLSFSLMGATELSARLFTALAGAAVVLLPLLFRDLIGQARALILSVLLACSPVLLAASRFDRPVIWSLLLGVAAVWAYWRYTALRQPIYAVLATALLVATVLLTEPAGFVMALVLIGAGLFAGYTSRGEETDVNTSRTPLLAGWPWRSALLVTAGSVFVVGTGLMLYPAGLSSVAGLLGAALAGVVQPSHANAPIFFPLLASLFYEPLTWLFGLAAIWLLARRGSLTFIERFFIGWLLTGVVASGAYRGAGPEHSLWVLIPLMGLASALVLDLLARDDHPLWNVPWWGKWLLAVVTVALMAMLSVHLQAIARALLTTPDDTIQGIILTLQRNSVNNLMFMLSILLTIGIYFTAASVWGGVASARGMALGLLAFGLVTALSSGWQVAITGADDPKDLWHVQPTSLETALLRETLVEVAKRESGGVLLTPVSVQASDDGVVAWLLRDFVSTTFIDEPGEARGQPVVLLKETGALPDLGGSYVGQTFVISSAWTSQTIALVDYPAWWLQRRTRVGVTPIERMTLWLRQDIYDGVSEAAG